MYYFNSNANSMSINDTILIYMYLNSFMVTWIELHWMKVFQQIVRKIIKVEVYNMKHCNNSKF